MLHLCNDRATYEAYKAFLLSFDRQSELTRSVIKKFVASLYSGYNTPSSGVKDGDHVRINWEEIQAAFKRDRIEHKEHA